MADYPFRSESAQLIKADGVKKVNIANIMAPEPNGDETISVSGAGVKTLTPPNEGSIRAGIVCPVECWVRFSAVPAVNAGEKFPAGSKIKLTSAEEIAAARIYVTAACTLFVLYSK